MSYGRIRTPRIYTSTIYHAVSTGKASLDNLNIKRTSVSGTDVAFNNSGVKTDIFDGKPYKLLEMATSVLSDDIHISFDTGITTDANQDSNFVAILGHNLEAVDGRFYVKTDDASDFSSAQSPTLTEVVNATWGSSRATPSKNGWSLATFSQTSDNQYIDVVLDKSAGAYGADISIGQILVGEYWDFPHSPDLSIDRSWTMDGIKQSRSTGGHTFSNATWIQPSNWFKAHMFNSTGDSQATTVTTHAGRQIIKMNFSYMDDTDVMPSNLYNVNDMFTDNSFISNIWNRALGSHHPILLQLDKDDATADDGFMWCRMTSEPKFSQVALNVWNVSLEFTQEI